MPLNGSSSSSTDGSCTSAEAILTRCRMPLEYVEIFRSCAYVHLDRGDRACGGRARVGQPVQLGVGQHELPAGEEVVQRLALGDQADRPVDLLVAPDRLAVEGDGAGGGRQEAGHHVDQRGLAGAVGAEQAGDAGADGHRDVVDRDDVAVPAGDVVELQVLMRVPAEARAQRVVRGVSRHLPVAEQQRPQRTEDGRPRWRPGRAAPCRCRSAGSGWLPGVEEERPARRRPA